ncbi:MAG: phosphoribosylanthranilate isomerase [Pyrinomonadaceae bacterium]
MHIKVCGITNLEDARAAIDAGADWLGFNFYQRSARYIAPAATRRIVKELPEELQTVGVFVNEAEPGIVARMADEAGVRAVQLHGDESPDYCRALRGRFVIKALRVGEDFAPETAVEYDTDAILLDAFDTRARGGTGRVFNWNIARRVRELVPKLFLAGGLTQENVAEAVARVEPFAVDACSGLERAPGLKDMARLRAFVDAARAVKP